MKTIRAALSVVVAVALLSFSGVATAQAAVTPAAERAEVVSLTNQTRALEGGKYLTESAQLNTIAQAWADEMAVSGYRHSTKEWRSSRMDPGFEGHGENIAWGQRDANEVVSAWIDSPGHYENIMDERYTRIGVGYNATQNLWVQIFAGYTADRPVVTPPAPAPAPSSVPAPEPAPVENTPPVNPAPVPPVVSPTPEVVRAGGATRFETSALVSSTFPANSPVAYIASGSNYPDALAAAAAAGFQDGPVLLVHKDEVPQVIINELTRLNPTRIVVIGGTAVISDRVQSIVGRYSATTRIGGATRFETAALVSSNTFNPGVPVAYVASGSNFPDALAGAAAAGSKGGPVLLVHQNEIPASVTAELARLQPQRIVVLGGTTAVSAELQANLNRYIAPTSRLGGATRFDTAALVSRDTFPSGASTVYVSSGSNYPDALAGAAAAGSKGAPVLLVHQNEIPTAVAAELDRLNPNRIVVLGGTTVISDSLKATLQRYVQ